MNNCKQFLNNFNMKNIFNCVNNDSKNMEIVYNNL